MNPKRTKHEINNVERMNEKLDIATFATLVSYTFYLINFGEFIDFHEKINIDSENLLRLRKTVAIIAIFQVILTVAFMFIAIKKILLYWL